MLVVIILIFIRRRLRCLIKKIGLFYYVVLFKGFLMTLGQLYFIQSSVTRNRCLTQLHYAHSQVTKRGTNRIVYLLVVEENGNDLFPREG